MTQLRETPLVTPAVTRETRTVTRVTRLRLISGPMCTCARARGKCFSRMDPKKPRNRVTRVTTGIPRVTDRVTHVTTPFHETCMDETSERGKKAAMIRAAFPTCVAFADAVRAVFPDARLTYASESGQQIGSPSPPGIHPVPQPSTGKPIADSDITTRKGRRS